MSAKAWDINRRYPRPVQLVPPWAAGRFYDANLNWTNITSQTHSAGDLHAVPIWVPAPIAIGSMGVEVSSGAGTGHHARFGVYNSLDGVLDMAFPYKLICQTADVDLSTTTGFKSGAVTFEDGWGGLLPEGLCWLVDVSYTTSTIGVLRSIGNAAIPTWNGAGFHAGTNDAPIANNIVNLGSYRISAMGQYVIDGLPKRFPFVSIGSNQLTSGASIVPRVMVAT